MRVPSTPDISAWIADRRWTLLRDEIASWPAPEVTDVLTQLPEDERPQLFRILPARLACETFAHLDREQQKSLWSALSEEEIRRLLDGLDADDRTRFLEGLPEDAREAAIRLLSPADARTAKDLLAYPEESVGRLMSPDFVAVNASWTVAQALAHIHASQRAPAAIASIYVTDDSFRLVDMIELPRFVLADPDDRVQTIMDGIYAALSPEDDREVAVNLMLKYDAVALPVVDADGSLLGVVTVDDVFDVAEEEATEDFHKQAAVAPLEGPYVEVGAWELFRKRIPWLAALVFVYLGASAIIGAFEDALSAQIVLASFIPLLMGSGGNVGAQAGTLTVRSLATGELQGSAWARVLAKEMVVGLAIGIAMGVLAAAVAHIRAGYEIAVVVTAAMALIVIVANVFGVLLPLALAGIGVDPAVAGSPIITSFTDVTSLLIYFWLANSILTL